MVGGAVADPPTPARVMTCGLLGALSTMVMVAERPPLAVGSKVTVMVQLPPAAKLFPMQLVVEGKSLGLLPPSLTLVMASTAAPPERFAEA